MNELKIFLEEEHSKVKNFKDSVFIKNATPISWLQDHDARLIQKVVEIILSKAPEDNDEEEIAFFSKNFDSVKHARIAGRFIGFNEANKEWKYLVKNLTI